MNENEKKDNSWLLENESYLKNRRRRRKTAVMLAAAALFIGAAVFFYLRDSDSREYLPGVEKYYDDLNKGSSHKAEYHDQEIKDSTQDFLDDAGYSNVNEWYAALQNADCEKMEEKYGKGFEVKYRIVSTEKLTDEELADIRGKAAAAGEFDKGYRLHIREHFIGSKDDGFEEQDITVSRLEGHTWNFRIGRWLELQDEMPYVQRIIKGE